MVSIDDIESVNARYTEELSGLGIRTTERLLEFGASKRARQELALESGMSEDKILRLVNRADLFRINSMKNGLADLLEATGINNIAELERHAPSKLHNAFIHLSDQRKLAYRIPSLNELEDIIAEAKQLPDVVID